MQLLPIIILCTIWAIASARPRQKRMVGAQFAWRGQFPYLVLVRRPGYECTGSIISPHWVLTAGHCISNAHHSRFRITAGTVSDWYGGDEKDQYVQHRRVSKVIEHESYDRFTNESIDTTFYDIGLLRLRKPFKITKYVNVTQLSVDPPPYSKPCAAIGFGSSHISPEDWEKLKEDPTQQRRTKRSEPLRYYEIEEPQYSPKDNGPKPCRLLRDMRFKESYQLCSIAGAPNTTHLYVGDSGGPLVCNGVQVGVYVLSEPKMYDGSLHIIEVHTSVYSFIHWIKKYVSDLVLPNANDVIQPIVPVATGTGVRNKWTTQTDKDTIHTRSAFAKQRGPQNSRTRGSPIRATSARLPDSGMDKEPTAFQKRK